MILNIKNETIRMEQDNKVFSIILDKNGLYWKIYQKHESIDFWNSHPSINFEILKDDSIYESFEELYYALKSKNYVELSSEDVLTHNNSVQIKQGDNLYNVQFNLNSDDTINNYIKFSDKSPFFNLLLNQYNELLNKKEEKKLTLIKERI